MGNTIKKEIRTDRFFEETQIRIKMTKEATGTAFTVTINGAKNCATYLYLAESAASKIPAIQAAKKPPKIRITEKVTESQKEPVQARVNNRQIAVTGETNSRSCPIAMAQICQMRSHAAIAHSFNLV